MEDTLYSHFIIFYNVMKRNRLFLLMPKISLSPLEKKVICKFMLSKNVNNKKCAPKLILFNEKKNEKDWDNF